MFLPGFCYFRAERLLWQTVVSLLHNAESALFDTYYLKNILNYLRYTDLSFIFAAKIRKAEDYAFVRIENR